MVKRRILADLIAVAHIGWVILIIITGIAAFFIPTARFFVLGMLAMQIIAQKIFYGCPLTLWENRLRHAIDKSFDLGEEFVYRVFGFRIPDSIQKMLTASLFFVVLAFGA